MICENPIASECFATSDRRGVVRVPDGAKFPARADVILPNLPPGSEYELIFATSGEVTGGNSLRAYNAFAASQRRRSRHFCPQV